MDVDGAVGVPAAAGNERAGGRIPQLLDLFCGAGGATRGYQEAGFRVTGVDKQPQPQYVGDTFVCAEALEYLRSHGHRYDIIHASPPCQPYSVLRYFARGDYPKLIEPVRQLLREAGKPYVIENVIGAPLDTPLLLCGSMFGLQTSCGARLRRHRLFESNITLASPGSCQHGGRHGRTITIIGSHARDPAAERRKYRASSRIDRSIRQAFPVAEARTAMGIDWMPFWLLKEAIPPAYTAWIGQQLYRFLLAHTRRALYGI